MFSDIEREYKKNLTELDHRFKSYYWPWAIAVLALALVADFLLKWNRWLVYGTVIIALAILVALFFFQDYRRERKKYPKRLLNIHGARFILTPMINAESKNWWLI